MHYVNDDSQVNTLRNDITKLKEEQYIAQLEKQQKAIQSQIDLLDEEIEKLEEQKSAIEDFYSKQSEAVKKYYEEQKKAAEESYKQQEEALKKQEDALDEYLKKLEEVLEKQKEPFEKLKDLQKEAQMQALFESYHIDMQKLLEGDQTEFDKLKGMYSSTADELNKLKTISDDTIASMGKIGIEVQNKMAPSVNNIKDFSSAFETFARNAGILDLSKISTDLQGVGTAASELQETLGTALGGGDNGDSILSSFDGLKTKADEVFGTSGGEGEGGEGLIGKFNELKTSVTDVTSAVGGGGGESSGEGGQGGGSKGEGSGEGGGEGLTGSITNLGAEATKTLGTTDDPETINGKFQMMSDVIAEAEGHVQGIKSGLEQLNDMGEVSVTINVNIQASGGAGLAVGTAEVDGTAIIESVTGMKLKSESYKASYGGAHAEGTAKLHGDWSVHQGGRSLVGELGQEIIVIFLRLCMVTYTENFS